MSSIFEGESSDEGSISNCTPSDNSRVITRSRPANKMLSKGKTVTIEPRSPIVSKKSGQDSAKSTNRKFDQGLWKKWITMGSEQGETQNSLALRKKLRSLQYLKHIE